MLNHPTAIMPGEFKKTELIDGVVVTTLLIDDSHDGWRADNFLCLHLKHFSRNKVQTFIDEGRIQMPGKRLKASTTLRPGNFLTISTEKTEEPPVDLDYKILFEDQTILVIDKPGNLPVHPAGRFLFNTLLMHLKRERALQMEQGETIHLIHRLDRETSGVLLIAKNNEVAGDLVRQFRERETEKKYYAVVRGNPPEDRFIVDADMGSDRTSEIRLKMAAFPKGQGELNALTEFEVKKRSASHALIDCELKTGRQHQIRVHLAYAGYPIVGDKLYGDGSRSDDLFLGYIKRNELSAERKLELGGVERQMLHSRYLKFYHPIKKTWIEIESPLPKDMEEKLNEV